MVSKKITYKFAQLCIKVGSDADVRATVSHISPINNEVYLYDQNTPWFSNPGMNDHPLGWM